MGKESLWRALGSGIAGACALTLVHQGARRLFPEEAPRMDLLGMRAIAGSLDKMGLDVPDRETLSQVSLAGDLLSNSLYYSLVGGAGGKSAWVRGALLGLGAGLGAVLLPGPMGLGRDASQRTPATQGMTVAWYLLGGLAAAATASLLASSDRR